MAKLTELERSKIIFFTNSVLVISEEFLLCDFDDFQYSRIQDAIAECETNYALVGSTSLVSEDAESVVFEVDSGGYVLETNTVSYDRSSRLSYGKTLTRYYNSVENLIASLGYVL